MNLSAVDFMTLLNWAIVGMVVSAIVSYIDSRNVTTSSNFLTLLAGLIGGIIGGLIGSLYFNLDYMEDFFLITGISALAALAISAVTRAIAKPVGHIKTTNTRLHI